MGRKEKKKKKIKLKSLGRNLKRYRRELKDTFTNFNWLQQFNLPHLTTPEELASFLDIDIYKLLEYCVAKKKTTPQEFPYRRFHIMKKSGEKRQILAPKKELKKIQERIHEEILKNIMPSDFAHGFREGYSIVTNARIHLGAQVIYNIDLKNFFPSIKFDKVFRLFKDVGYSGRIASLLAALCTIPPRHYYAKKKQWILDRSSYYSPNLHYVPQGAPTSPIISNLVCLFLDDDLNRIANEYNFKFTRYADDITFSSLEKEGVSEDFRKLIKKFVYRHGFRINWQKERDYRRFNLRRVTGIVIHDDYLSLPRDWIRKLRAAMYELKSKKFNMEDKSFIELMSNIEGRCAYARMVNKEIYAHFYEEFKSLKASKFK